VRLRYSWVWTSTQQPESADYNVRLSATQPPLGGLRWWFLCPLTVSGRPCNRRVAVLHLPPDGRYFACRHCHQLTYRSCQESHKYDNHYRWLAPEMGQELATVKWMMNGFARRWRR